ncbi:7434_t:CDS:2, partial [Gigaspora margarita]
TLTNKEIADTRKTDQASNYKQDDMQTDKPTTNKKTSYNRKMKTSLETSELPEKEMIAKPSDLLKNKLALLYRKEKVIKKLQPELDRNK